MWGVRSIFKTSCVPPAVGNCTVPVGSTRISAIEAIITGWNRNFEQEQSGDRVELEANPVCFDRRVCSLLLFHHFRSTCAACRLCQTIGVIPLHARTCSNPGTYVRAGCGERAEDIDPVIKTAQN